MSVERIPGTVAVLGKRVPAESRTIKEKFGSGYTIIVRRTRTGRTVTCGSKIAASFEPDSDVHNNDLATSYQMLNGRNAMVKRLQQLVERVEYRPDSYWYVVGVTPGMKYPYIQLKHNRPDCNTGELGTGGSGKVYVNEWSSDSEVYQLMLGLAIAYEQHEVREFFKVDGERIYGPHIAWYALAEVCNITDARQQQDLNR